MYAVIKAGCHQYRVEKGESLTIDKVEGQVGDKVSFDQVLLLKEKEEEGVILGKPTVKGAFVEAVIREQKRAPKVIIFKYKRRKNYKKKRGHKQPLTTVEIQKIGKK